jgi:O-methyltransferase
VVGSGERLVPERELEATYKRALQSLIRRDGPQSVGDYLEFGVYTGTSLLCMARASEALGLEQMRLFGFDSFEGLPAVADNEATPWASGDMKADPGYVRARLAENGVDLSRLVLVEGWFEHTLNGKLIRDSAMRKASVVMIDCNLYSSAKTALTFVAPLIRDRAILLFDDWYAFGLAEDGLGEKRAFDEFLAENPELTAEEFGSYTENAKVFIVMRRLGPPA